MNITYIKMEGKEKSTIWRTKTNSLGMNDWMETLEGMRGTYHKSLLELPVLEDLVVARKSPWTLCKGFGFLPLSIALASLGDHS